MSDKKDFNTSFAEALGVYGKARSGGKSHADAVKIVQTKYTGVGPGNQERLEKGYKPEPKPPAPKPPAPKPEPKPKPPSDGDVISTLDLRSLTKGGGSWNINKYNLKKSVVTTVKGDTVVKCVYDKNSGTTNDPGVGGFSFEAIPDRMDKDAITFSWEVFYPAGFKFARGGKYGGVHVGYGDASGYRHSTTGASNRIMWQEDGGVIDYIYPAEGLKQKNPALVAEGHGCGLFGSDFAKAMKTGVWNKLSIGTKMNSFKNGVPQSDGETYVIANGKKEIIKGINWSKSPDLKISQFDIGTFFGGPLPSPVDQYCLFRNFQMCKY
jgi:hypothetical protein